jgi:quercetin dioxygenase-like cupin family protein
MMRSTVHGDRRGVLRGMLVAAASALGRPPGARAARSPPVHRRVVTGVNASGNSAVLIDGPVPPDGTWARKGQYGSQAWLVDRIPVDLADSRDPIAGHPLGALPPPGGAFFRMFTWEPGSGFDMHQTPTIDFLVVVSGRMELLMEEGSAKLGPGDCVVQRGTRHAWRVVGDEPCTFAAVFLPAAQTFPKE